MVADAPYRPHGGAAKMIECKDPAILIDGPVGTGKTMGVLYKGIAAADKYPGSRILLCRKTRKSLTESVLVTFEDKILVPGAPVEMHGGERKGRTHYTLPNGSVMVCGGMDPGAATNSRASVMSTEWDLILCFEATEFTEDEIQKLQTRLRNGAIPYQQIIMDCNPGPPQHFLIRGAMTGKYTRCPSRHVDNPRLWNGTDWTDEGRRYMALLDQLTGHRLLRLRDGKWAGAEGVVYPEWDAAVHVIDVMPKGWESWRKIRSIDFGYTNPFVCQWWAIDGDGRMYLYREIYRPQIIVEDHAKEIHRLSAGERIEATIADHDAEDRATLDRHGIGTAPALKDITVGIQAVANRLRKAGDGKPRLFMLRDARSHAPDAGLVDRKKPACTSEEMDGYCWPPDKEGKPIKEVPVDVDNHGADSTRYAVMYVDGGMNGTGFTIGTDIASEPPPARLPELQAASVAARFSYEDARKDPNWGF